MRGHKGHPHGTHVRNAPFSSSTLADSLHLSAPDSRVPTPHIYICTLYIYAYSICSLKSAVRVVGVRVLFNITAC